MSEQLGIYDRDQYRFRIYENAEIINERPITDPFITTTIVPKGFRAAFRVLFGRLKFVVQVTGSAAAHRVVFTGDYRDPVYGVSYSEICHE